MPTSTAAVKLSAVCTQSTLMANSPLMCIVTRPLPVEAGRYFKRDWTALLIFYRGWNDYKAGFGSLNGEYWLGLDKLNKLTTNNHKRYKLRVDLEDTTGKIFFAEYGYFALSSEQSKYQLSLGTYHGKPTVTLVCTTLFSILPLFLFFLLSFSLSFP